MLELPENLEELVEVSDREALRSFIDEHMADALRIVATKLMFESDKEMLYQAVCLVVGIYFKKLANDEYDDIPKLH